MTTSDHAPSTTSRAPVTIVVDTSGSTEEVRFSVARLVAQLVAAVEPTPTAIYSWAARIDPADLKDFDLARDGARCSWDALADFLADTPGDVVVVTDACMSHESDVAGVRRAEESVRERQSRLRATHVVLIGDSPDEAAGARIQSGDGTPFNADQVHSVAGALRGPR